MATEPGLPVLDPVVSDEFNLLDEFLLVDDTVYSLVGFGEPRWGIYNGENNPIAISDTVMSVDFKQGWHISDYPIERGDFVSYNKVQTPFNAKVTLVKGGTNAERAQFLSAVENAAASLDMVSIVTPEVTYLDSNIESYNYRRSALNGATLLIVEISLIEIRQIASQNFVVTVDPSGADSTDDGPVQTTTPTQAQTEETTLAFGGT